MAGNRFELRSIKTPVEARTEPNVLWMHLKSFRGLGHRSETVEYSTASSRKPNPSISDLWGPKALDRSTVHSPELTEQLEVVFHRDLGADALLKDVVGTDNHLCGRSQKP